MELQDIIADLTRKSNLSEEAFSAYWENIGGKGEMPDKQTLSDAEDCYIGEFKSLSHLAEHLVDDLGLLDQMPENLRCYFDYDAYGRDLSLGGDVWEENGHFFWNR